MVSQYRQHLQLWRSEKSSLLMYLNICYTLKTTGSEFGYGLGRKVSETHHMVLGWHTKTGQLIVSGLGSGRLTLQHQRTLGQVPAQTGKAQVLPQRKTTLVVIIGHTSNRKENGNARSCESRSRNRSRVVSRGTAPRGTIPQVGNRCIVADGSKAQGDNIAPCGQRHKR